MKPNAYISLRTLLGCLVLGTLCSASVFGQNTQKKLASSASDLPQLSYSVPEDPADLFNSEELYLPFAAKVRADLESVLESYDVQDKSLARRLETVLTYLDFQDGKLERTEQRIKRIRGMESPGGILNNGDLFVIESVLKATRASGESSGPKFEAAFGQSFNDSVMALPDSLRPAVIAEKDFFGDITEEFLAGELTRYVAPAAKKNGGTISLAEVQQILSARVARQFFVPLKTIVTGAYASFAAARKPASIWPDRSVTLSGTRKLTPVVVGIWDSGVDLRLFPKNIFANKREKLNGKDDDGNGFVDDRFGIGFDIKTQPTTELMHPVEAKESAEFPMLVRDRNAQADILDGIDSEETRAFKKRFRSQKPEDAVRSDYLRRVFAEYSHGTGVAGVAVAGNPAVRILVIRQALRDETGERIAPTAGNVRSMADSYKRIVAYLKANKARVVTMSWVTDPQELLDDMKDRGIGSSDEERKTLARERFALLRDALAEAIRSAPEILFVAGAGNAGVSSDATETIPAAFDLPNILTVGAVDASGATWNRSNFGKTVRIYGLGVGVDVAVPGGAKMRANGTSWAAPQVAGLAAKLFAIDPNLKVGQVVELILKGADPNSGGARIVNPKRSVELLDSASLPAPARRVPPRSR